MEKSEEEDSKKKSWNVLVNKVKDKSAAVTRKASEAVEKESKFSTNKKFRR